LISISHDGKDMELIKEEIDHWSEIEDEGSIHRSKENKHNSPYLLHAGSLFKIVILVTPFDCWLVCSIEYILQITIIVSSNNI